LVLKCLNPACPFNGTPGSPQATISYPFRKDRFVSFRSGNALLGT
jgi:hypothetical protein